MDDSDRGAIPLLVADDNSFAQPAEETPKDTGNVAYMIFFLMGAGTLLPSARSTWRSVAARR